MKEIILSIQSPFGPPIELTQFTWEGAQKKDTVSIVSGIQGNHLNGIYICSRLVRFLNLVESGKETGYYIKGGIKIIPAINIPAIQEGKGMWSLHDLDMNLAFPGNDRGEVTEQITASVYRHTKDSRIGVILKSAEIHYEDTPHLMCLNPDGLTKDFARSLGLQIAREPKTSSNFKLSLHSQWLDQMMTSVVLSAGKPNHLDINLCETIFFGLINGLLWAGVLGNDRKKPIKNQLKFNSKGKELIVFSSASGFFLPNAKLGSEVQKGQNIGSIVDIYSNTTLESIFVNSSGYLVTLRNYPIVYQGEMLAILLRKSKLLFWPFNK